MPIYEYQCAKCGFQTEVLQKISDAPLKKCPECGKPAMEKMVSAPSFRLKGSGWYETDFKSGNKKNVADSGGDKKPSAKKKAGKKSSGGSSTTTKKNSK
jgi:putative FmdB family regulatory protein